MRCECDHVAQDSLRIRADGKPLNLRRVQCGRQEGGDGYWRRRSARVAAYLRGARPRALSPLNYHVGKRMREAGSKLMYVLLRRTCPPLEIRQSSTYRRAIITPPTLQVYRRRCLTALRTRHSLWAQSSQTGHSCHNLNEPCRSARLIRTPGERVPPSLSSKIRVGHSPVIQEVRSVS